MRDCDGLSWRAGPQPVGRSPLPNERLGTELAPQSTNVPLGLTGLPIALHSPARNDSTRLGTDRRPSRSMEKHRNKGRILVDTTGGLGYNHAPPGTAG